MRLYVLTKVDSEGGHWYAQRDSGLQRNRCICVSTTTLKLPQRMIGNERFISGRREEKVPHLDAFDLGHKVLIPGTEIQLLHG